MLFSSAIRSGLSVTVMREIGWRSFACASLLAVRAAAITSRTAASARNATRACGGRGDHHARLDGGLRDQTRMDCVGGVRSWGQRLWSATDERCVAWSAPGASCSPSA